MTTRTPAHNLLRNLLLVAALSLSAEGCASAVTRGIGGGIAVVGAGTACVGAGMATGIALCGEGENEDEAETSSVYESSDPETGAVVLGIGLGATVLGGILYGIGATDPPTGIANNKSSVATW